MSTQACPQCKSANLASAVLCVNCGTRLGVPPQPTPPAEAPPPPSAEWGRPLGSQPGEAPPPAPPMPAGAGVQYWGSAPGYVPVPPRRRSWLVPVLALVAVVVVVIGVMSVLGGGGGSLPDEIDGLARLDTAQASFFEDTMEGLKYGDVRMEGAMYGEGEQPALVVGIMSNLSAADLQAPLEFTFDQAAGGFAGASGGTVDSAGAVSTSIAGVDYRCAAFDVPNPAAGGSGRGSMCMWLADDIGFVITFRTSDPSTAFTDVHTAYDTIHGA